MKLNEEILRIKKIMGLNESTENKVFYNLDMIEQTPDMVEPKVDNTDNDIEKPNDVEISDDDFSESVVQDVVWRAGDIKLNPMAGGIWFADTKEGVENFALSVRGEKREGKAYKINLKNPYYFERFWSGYIKTISGPNKNARKELMENLKSKGHDGIIIGADWWNDTGDEYAVYGKQYIVFDESNIKPM